MTWGRMKVRNACPFPVTFYALAGPTLELAANDTQTAHACLIWFSTRVKGPGDAINLSDWEQFSGQYIQQLEGDGIDPSDWEDGGSGAAAGSILGWAVSQLSGIFKVKNTQPDVDAYFGAKKEGVYGSSNLVVYATLDPIYKLDQSHKIWYLHLEHDTGQVTPPYNSDPMYIKPNLSAYADTMFVRACNASGYLAATRDKEGVEVLDHSEPYNPLEYPSYWSIQPEHGNDTREIKILNVYAQKWLTDYSTANNKVGLYPVGYADYEDQHWDITEIGKNPEVVTIRNSATGLNLFINSSGGIGVYNPDYADQHFTIQTFTVHTENIPDGVTFRIMHAQTGKYITITEAGTARLDDTDANNQLFYIKNLDGDLKICNVAYNSYLTFYWTENSSGLGTCSMSYNAYEHSPDQVWEFSTDPELAGVYIKNKLGIQKGMPNLYYDTGGVFGLYSGNFQDQLWVFQLETTDPS